MMLESIKCNHQQLVLAAFFLLLDAKYLKAEKTHDNWYVSVLKQLDGYCPKV
jgi:hypothetical protein